MVEIMEFIMGLLFLVACFWASFTMTEIIREVVLETITQCWDTKTYSYRPTKNIMIPEIGIEKDKEVFISSFLGGLLEYIKLFPEEHDQIKGEYSPRELTLGSAKEELTALAAYEETGNGLVFWEHTLCPMPVLRKKGEYSAPTWVEKTVAF